MKISIPIIISFLLYSCQYFDEKSDNNKIIYHIKPAVQDTISKTILHRTIMYENTTAEVLFFIKIVASKNSEEHIIILDCCSSSDEEITNGRDGCMKYRNIINNTNRFLKLHKKLLPIVVNSDLYFTESKDYLITKLGGTTLFYLDTNGDLKETGITM